MLETDLRPSKPKVVPRRLRISKSEESKRLRLYQQRLNDREIAECCGVHKVTINAWRRSRNLPSNPRKPRHAYDHEQLRLDYAQGMSCVDLHKKYGIAPSHASKIMHQAGIIRTESETLLFKAGGWRKLIPMRESNTRILSLPISIIQGLGFDPNDELEGKWQTSSKKLILRIQKRGSK